MCRHGVSVSKIAKFIRGRWRRGHNCFNMNRKMNRDMGMGNRNVCAVSRSCSVQGICRQGICALASLALAQLCMPFAEVLDRWARVARGSLRLAFKRHQWAFLGLHLRRIKQRGLEASVSAAVSGGASASEQPALIADEPAEPTESIDFDKCD